MKIGLKKMALCAALTTGMLLAPLNGCKLGSTALTGLLVLSIVLFIGDILNTPSSST